MFDFFKSVVPLLVVLLTGVVSGIVVPDITRHWQDHEKELQLKTSMVDSINDAVMQIVLAVQFVENNSLEQQKFDEAYQKWEVQSAVLSGRLKAYFGDPKISDTFDRFAEAMSEVYALSGTVIPALRLQRVDKLKAYFGDQAVDWKTVSDLQLRQKNSLTWFEGWWTLRTEVLRRKDMVVRELLAAKVDFLNPKRSAVWPWAR